MQTYIKRDSIQLSWYTPGKHPSPSHPPAVRTRGSPREPEHRAHTSEHQRQSGKAGYDACSVRRATRAALARPAQLLQAGLPVLPVRRREHGRVDRHGVHGLGDVRRRERLRRRRVDGLLRRVGEEDEGRAGRGDGHLAHVLRLVALDGLHVLRAFPDPVDLEPSAKRLTGPGDVVLLGRGRCEQVSARKWAAEVGR